MDLKTKPEHVLIGNAKRLLEIVHANGMLVGSRRWKINSQESDFDYVIPASFINDLVDLDKLTEYNEGNNLPSSCFYVQINNISINIIVTFNEQEFNAWHASAVQFDELMKSPIFAKVANNKSARVAVFETLREINGLTRSNE